MFFVLIFFTIVFTFGNFLIICIVSSFSFGISFPFITIMHIISLVFIPIFVTICLINPFLLVSSYTLISFSFINSKINLDNFCISLFWIKHSSIGIISCVLFANTPITTLFSLSFPIGNCALFL